ncbi:MAG: cation:proton antiporter subunit C [Spirochaetia bacterium]|jgi:multicomponent Na+:H+ antiporter subunit C|nr:cation:proton antiporter subunit C [Spirochaetia bacterium]
MISRILMAAIFLVGLWGVIADKNMMRKVFGLTILTSAVVLLFVVEGGSVGTEAPIMEETVSNIVDPVPQALMLTAIVIGVCITALALALVCRIHASTGTLDIEEAAKRMGDGH